MRGQRSPRRTQAFKSWRKVGAHEKAELLHEVARKIRARTEELATLLTREGGKPLIENRDEMGWSAACFDYYAELQRNTRGRVIPSVEPSQLAMVLKEPYGVVAAIVPWNYPILLMTWKVAPALAAGNSVIIKPSEMTPLTTLLFAEIFDHLPPGVVNIVTGFGATVGRELVVSPHTHMIAFTGSFATGRENRAPGRRAGQEDCTWSWAARTPSSSPRMPTWMWPCRAWPGPRCSTPGRSAPRPSASMSTRAS